LELLEDKEFVVSAADPIFTLDLLEDLLPPSGSYHAFDRDRIREIALADSGVSSELRRRLSGHASE
jgi:hypothetical protein